MRQVNYKSYCDKERDGQDPSNSFFRLGTRGRAVFCGIAYPAVGSRGREACETVLQVAGDSFLRRPSVCDEAVETISDFVNGSVYALQRPYDNCFCSTAILFAFQGKARWAVSGNVKVWHFQDGRLADVSGDENRHQILGEKVSWEGRADAAPVLDISQGSHGFLFWGGPEGADSAQCLCREAGQPFGTEEWLAQMLEGFEKEACAAAVCAFAQKRRRFWRRDC